jgi:hypothetical protein
MIASNVPPMTLGNMRSNGVRSLLVYCFACRTFRRAWSVLGAA